MSRDEAIARAERHFDSGAFKQDVARLVAMPTESQNPDRASVLHAYLEQEMMPMLAALGFQCRDPGQSEGEGPVPVRRTDGGRAATNRIRIRPRRCDPRTRGGLGSGPFALDADRGRRPLVRAWRGGQQGAARHQHRRHACRSRDARQAPLQRQVPDRDGRGDGLARAARAVRRAQRPAAPRRPDRLRRPPSRPRASYRFSWARAAA